MFIAPTPCIHYYRLRASTINANVPEPFFQTLERHWDTVVEWVAAFIDTLVHRTRRRSLQPARRLMACLSCGRGDLWTAVSCPAS